MKSGYREAVKHRSPGSAQRHPGYQSPPPPPTLTGLHTVRKQAKRCWAKRSTQGNGQGNVGQGNGERWTAAGTGPFHSLVLHSLVPPARIWSCNSLVSEPGFLADARAVRASQTLPSGARQARRHTAVAVEYFPWLATAPVSRRCRLVGSLGREERNEILGCKEGCDSDENTEEDLSGTPPRSSERGQKEGLHSVRCFVESSERTPRRSQCDARALGSRSG